MAEWAQGGCSVHIPAKRRPRRPALGLSHPAVAQQRALAEILQFGHPVYDVKFKTLQTGLVIGQTILLNSLNSVCNMLMHCSK